MENKKKKTKMKKWSFVCLMGLLCLLFCACSTSEISNDFAESEFSTDKLANIDKEKSTKDTKTESQTEQTEQKEQKEQKEERVEKLLEESTRKQGELTGENLTEKPMENPTERPMENPTERPMEKPLEKQANNPQEADYWLLHFAEDTTPLLSLEQIIKFNQSNASILETGLTDLSSVPDFTSEEIAQRIEKYSIPNRPFFDNKEFTEEKKEALREKRNLESLYRKNRTMEGTIVETQTDTKESFEQEKNNQTYGFLIQNTDLRSFPTDKRLTKEPNGRYDYLQETKLSLGEPVYVLHFSTDNEWCFVQAEHYCGWIKEEAIAFCEQEEFATIYQELSSFSTIVQEEAFVVVLKNVQKTIGNQKIELRMGTKLLIKKDNRDNALDGSENETITILLPQRDVNKKLVWNEYEVSLYDTDATTLFHKGFLPYTRQNLVHLAKRLLDTPYAWGDAPSFGETGVIGMDCSSTVGAIYRCFGLFLPRNTSEQQKMSCDQVPLSDCSSKEKKEQLQKLQGGELLFMPGHVMLYLGQVEEEYYIFHNTTSASLDDGGTIAFDRAVITTLSIGKTGATIFDRLTQISFLDAVKP